MEKIKKEILKILMEHREISEVDIDGDTSFEECLLASDFNIVVEEIASFIESMSTPVEKKNNLTSEVTN